MNQFLSKSDTHSWIHLSGGSDVLCKSSFLWRWIIIFLPVMMFQFFLVSLTKHYNHLDEYYFEMFPLYWLILYVFMKFLVEDYIHIYHHNVMSQRSWSYQEFLMELTQSQMFCYLIAFSQIYFYRNRCYFFQVYT